MRRVLNVTLLFSLSLLMAASVAAWSQETANFSPAELDELFAPIALYSDPLLAQILPAATYPDQLDAASDLIIQQRGPQMIDDQAWDVSVKSVAHYPSVLRLMVDSPDWTASVGQAYFNQPDDVMSSIQRLRGKARLMGYLNSNSYQTVAYSGGYTSIVPAQAQYMYVPTYDPQVVYVTRRPSYGAEAISFGLGMLIGAWLNNAIDWNHNRVYNHGWNGGGWVGRSRSYVQTNNQYYAGRPVTVNRNMRARDISGYRQNLQSGAGTFRTPGLNRQMSPAPTLRPGATQTRPGTARPAYRQPGASAVPAVPRTRPAAVVPPGAGPNTSYTRHGTSPNAGVTYSSPAAVPSAPVARSRYIPKPSSGVTTPSPRGRYSTPQASPNAPAVRSTPRANAGTVRQAPAAGQSNVTTRSSGKAANANGKQAKGNKGKQTKDKQN
jgi:hypothetical protein